MLQNLLIGLVLLIPVGIVVGSEVSSPTFTKNWKWREIERQVFVLFWSISSMFMLWMLGAGAGRKPLWFEVVLFFTAILMWIMAVATNRGEFDAQS